MKICIHRYLYTFLFLRDNHLTIESDILVSTKVFYVLFVPCMYFSNSVRAPAALHLASGVLSLLNINCANRAAMEPWYGFILSIPSD